MLVENKANGLTLDNSSDILLKNVDKFIEVQEKFKDSEKDLEKWGSFEKIKIDRSILKY